MATISEVKGKFRVVIRKKEQKLSATFSTKEKAELWAFYKENLIDDLNNFSPPEDELITFEDAIDLKIESMKDHADRSIKDVFLLKETFSEFLNSKIFTVSFDDLYNHFIKITETPIKVGGSKDQKTGVLKLPEKATVIRKFKILSSVYGFLIGKGVRIDNIVLQVMRRIENL